MQRPPFLSRSSPSSRPTLSGELALTLTSHSIPLGVQQAGKAPCSPSVVGLVLARMSQALSVCLLLGVEFTPSAAALVDGRRMASIPVWPVRKE